MTEKRFCVVVYDDKAINGFAVLDLQKPNSRLRLRYENVYIGSKQGCKIVCRFGNSLADENKQLKLDNNRLVNETAKIIAEHQRKVLNLIDEKIKDYNQQLDDEDIDDNLAYYMNVKGHIEAFKELKKELQE